VSMCDHSRCTGVSAAKTSSVSPMAGSRPHSSAYARYTDNLPSLEPHRLHGNGPKCRFSDRPSAVTPVVRSSCFHYPEQEFAIACIAIHHHPWFRPPSALSADSSRCRAEDMFIPVPCPGTSIRLNAPYSWARAWALSRLVAVPARDAATF